MAVMVALLNAQEPARMGNQIFRIPPGWARADSPAGAVIAPAAEPKDSVVLLLSGRPLNGDFRAAFDQMVAAINGNLRPLAPGQVQGRHISDGVDLLADTLEFQAPNHSHFKRFYLAASVRGRFESVIYSAATVALFQRYWPVVNQFVSTWTFASLASQASPSAESSAEPPPRAADPPPAPTAEAAPRTAAAAATSGPLDGIYSGYKFIYATVVCAVQRKAVNDYFSFFPDGSVFWGLPQTGLAGFDMARACQGKVEFCGTYQMNGDQLLISLNRGTYRQAGSRNAAGLQIEDRQYTLEGDPSKSAAHVLDGVFVRADARPGEDLARHFIRFTRDGQFVDQGIVTSVVSADISTGSPRFERPAGAGTYRLAPYTLILRYQDGYVRQLGVTIKPVDVEKPQITQLFVNTYTLVRR
jgi:hypothetical protein